MIDYSNRNDLLLTHELSEHNSKQFHPRDPPNCYQFITRSENIRINCKNYSTKIEPIYLKCKDNKPRFCTYFKSWSVEKQFFAQEKRKKKNLFNCYLEGKNFLWFSAALPSHGRMFYDNFLNQWTHSTNNYRIGNKSICSKEKDLNIDIFPQNFKSTTESGNYFVVGS